MVHRGINSFDIVSRFVAVSEFVKAVHVRAGLPADKFAVRHNFAWDVAARPREGYFIYLGRLSEEKGADVIVDAWSAAPGELLVVGDGPERARLEARARGRIRFTGPVPPARALELLAGARALLIPSRCYEGSPKTVGEAFAAGVPVIASDIGALPEFVRDDATGLLVAPGNTAGWVEAAARLMDDALADRLGGEARAEWERRFNPGRSIEQIESIYAEVAASQ
jgi:glycosyltransferase involved in cell wall biosynthesis